MKRVVDPESCRERILQDDFLYFTYSRNYLEMLKQRDTSEFKNYQWEQIKEALQNLRLLEIGSAGGILKEFFSEVRTSDVREGTGVDEFQDGQSLSLLDDSIDIILAKDTLHHLPDVEKHFMEVNRVLKSGGNAIYIEPNWNVVSRLVFKYLHPEDWDMRTKTWKFISNNPLDANQALARMVFIRDSQTFRRKFPELDFEIHSKPINGLSYLISGGVNQRTIIPSSILIGLAKIESASELWMKLVGFNRIITVRKK